MFVIMVSSSELSLFGDGGLEKSEGGEELVEGMEASIRSMEA